MDLFRGQRSEVRGQRSEVVAIAAGVVVDDPCDGVLQPQDRAGAAQRDDHIVEDLVLKG